jgi:hypothetical protein
MSVTRVENTVPGASEDEIQYLLTLKLEYLLIHSKEISRYQLDIYKRGGRVSPEIKKGIHDYYRHQLKVLKKILNEK